VPFNRIQDDDRSDNPRYLAFVNIESINSRWVDNIGKFLEAAEDQVYHDYGDEIAETMKDDEKEWNEDKKRFKPKMVEGAAWVIEIRGYTDHKDGAQFVKQALLKNLRDFDRFAKDEKKIGRDFIVGVQDPVKGKVSHAFVYKVWPVENPQPNSFVYINQSYLDGLMGGGSGAPGGPPGGFGGKGFPGGQGPMGPMGPMGPTDAAPAGPTTLGPAWSGLSSSSLSGSSATDGLGGFKPPGAFGSGPPFPGPPTSGGPGTAGFPPLGKDPKEGRHYDRYEFVVMFVWHEPVPSVAPNPDAPAPAPTGPPGSPGISGAPGTGGRQ
jgi:hypothetical protein